MHHLKNGFCQGICFLQRIYWHFQAEKCTTRAAGLAYTTLLSIVPLTVVGLVVLKAFPNYQNLINQLQQFIFTNFVANSAQLVEQHLSHFVEQATKLSASSILFLIVAAVLMIFNIESAFNAIMQVEKRRHGVAAFLMYWAVLTLLPLLITLGFAVSAKISDYLTAYHVNDFIFMKLLYYASPFFIAWLAFALLYIAVPNCKVPLASAIAGAFVAALLFEGAKSSFTFYMTHFPTYALIYGALAAVPIFLIWIYLSWLIVLLGAVIAFVLSGKSHSLTDVKNL